MKGAEGYCVFQDAPKHYPEKSSLGQEMASELTELAKADRSLRRERSLSQPLGRYNRLQEHPRGGAKAHHNAMRKPEA